MTVLKPMCVNTRSRASSMRNQVARQICSTTVPVITMRSPYHESTMERMIGKKSCATGRMAASRCAQVRCFRSRVMPLAAKVLACQHQLQSIWETVRETLVKESSTPPRAVCTQELERELAEVPHPLYSQAHVLRCPMLLSVALGPFAASLFGWRPTQPRVASAPLHTRARARCLCLEPCLTIS